MPIPLAHPAAVLPLRRFCPRWLDLPALVVGSMAPDFAYCLDRVNKFSSFASWVLGARGANSPWVTQAWDWDDFSHDLLGSVVFCLPAGLLALALFYALREAFVRTLPKPHRDALLPLCQPRAWAWRPVVLSLLVGILTHVVWDGLTNADRWLGSNWTFLHYRLDLGLFRMELARLLWVVSSVGGTGVLFLVYARFLKGRVRSCREDFEPGRYLLWGGFLCLCAAAAVVLALRFASFGGPGRLEFLHRFAGFFIAICTLGIVVVSLGSGIQRHYLQAK